MTTTVCHMTWWRPGHVTAKNGFSEWECTTLFFYTDSIKASVFRCSSISICLKAHHWWNIDALDSWWGGQLFSKCLGTAMNCQSKFLGSSCRLPAEPKGNAAHGASNRIAVASYVENVQPQSVLVFLSRHDTLTVGASQVFFNTF